MIKTYVLDTNVLIHNPRALETFEDNKVVIPLGVIEELDTFKKYEDERGRNAREVARLLDALRKTGNLQEGVALPNGGTLRVDISTPNGHLPAALSHMKIDNNIIGIALALKEKGENVKFNLERATYWISKGAQPSDTVASFIRHARKAAPAA